MPRLSLGLCLADRDPSLAGIDLRLDDLILKLVHPRLILLRQVQVQLGDLEDLHANLGKIWTLLDDRPCHVSAGRAEIHHGEVARLEKSSQCRAHPHHQLIANPLHGSIWIRRPRLPDELQHEPNGIRDSEGVRAESPRIHADIELGIPHRPNGPPESLVVLRLGGDEVDLADEDVPTGELVDNGVEERDVLGLQRVTSRTERPDVAPILEEEGDLVRVNGQLTPERKGLIGMFVDDLVFERVVARNHHALHATLDEVDDSHVLTLPQRELAGAEPHAIPLGNMLLGNSLTEPAMLGE